jgi:hypothetical protein
MVGFVGSCAQAVKDIIGTEKEQTGTTRLGGFRNIHSARAIHCECQLSIALAAIYVGVGGGQDNPFGLSALYSDENLLGVANVGVFRGEAGDFIRFPLADQCVAEQSGGAEDCDSHAQFSLVKMLEAINIAQERSTPRIAEQVRPWCICRNSAAYPKVEFSP